MARELNMNFYSLRDSSRYYFDMVGGERTDIRAWEERVTGGRNGEYHTNITLQF
jgi:hypothetical protein